MCSANPVTFLGKLKIRRASAHMRTSASGSCDRSPSKSWSWRGTTFANSVDECTTSVMPEGTVPFHLGPAIK
jgi:hypothetical protein